MPQHGLKTPETSFVEPITAKLLAEDLLPRRPVFVIYSFVWRILEPSNLRRNHMHASSGIRMGGIGNADADLFVRQDKQTRKATGLRQCNFL